MKISMSLCHRLFNIVVITNFNYKINKMCSLFRHLQHTTIKPINTNSTLNNDLSAANSKPINAEDNVTNSNNRTSIISIGSSDDSFHRDNLKTPVKTSINNTEDEHKNPKEEKIMSSPTFKPKFLTRTIRKPKIRFVSSSDSDTDIVKPALRVNKKNRILDDSEHESEAHRDDVILKTEHNASPKISLVSSQNNVNKGKVEEKKKIETDSPKTQKQIIRRARKENIVISDSDSSPHFKSSYRRTPQKQWVGPDFKLDLKPLDLGKNLDPWIESAKGRPIMSSIPDTKAQLEDRFKQLKDFQIEILEKVYIALERIPLPVLEKFPNFNAQSYQDLKILHQHVKAKIRLTEKKLMHVQTNENIKSSNEHICESKNSFVPPITPRTSNHQSTVNASDVFAEEEYFSDSFNLSTDNLTNSNYVRTIQTESTISPMKIECFSPLEKKNESQIKEQIHNNSVNFSPLQGKKGAFQLKRPIKATVVTNVSKQIEEIWEKEEKCKTLNSAAIATDEHTRTTSTHKPGKEETKEHVQCMQEKIVSNKHTIITGMYKPEQCKTNENTQFIQKKEEDSSQFNAKSTQENIQDDWGDIFDAPDNSYSENIVDCLTQEFEQFPPLNKESNINTSWNFSTQDDDVNDNGLKNDKKNTKSAKVQIETGNFTGNYKNDGVSGEFDSETYPHSREMLKVFRQKFGLYSFRPNQLQAINAALLGFDCFVLMPTGGGKSLCYQLPALLVPGVTIVVSPLKSLIFDQVQKLTSLDIPAAHMCGGQTDSQSDGIYRELAKKEPALKLLYVTPEKISASQRLCDCLLTLYQRGLLARFIIDEAHCVSQWGHDFRPDYKRLKCLRQNYPKVPTIALTATATPRVRTDILYQLGLNKPKWFMSSFNRPNLRYSIISKKGKNCAEEVVAMIKTKYKNECGIVYCLSRKDCDDYAVQLKKNSIRALSYHAGLTDNNRSDIQGRWISEEIHVICATIAFGMGIDKPNVRFVIHAALPKSIEGYYQESGRAGRDGDNADCILFYNYTDMHRIRKMLELDNSNPEILKTHMDNLFKMVSFCENRTDCRRALQLNYFGEIFDRQQCLVNKATSCDNCRNKDDFRMLDATDQAKHIMKGVREINQMRNCNLTMVFLTDIFKGSDLKKIRDSGLTKHPLYGYGRSWNRGDIERLLHIMVLKEYLQETMYIRNEIACAYVKIGAKASELMTKKDIKILIPMRSSNNNSAAVATVSTVTKKTDKVLQELRDRCYKELMEIIKGIAGALDISASSVMNMIAIRAMSQKLPDNEESMLQIPHVTKANFEKYGKALLDITRKYAAEYVLLNEEMVESSDNDDNDTWSADVSTYSGKTYSTGGTKRKGKAYYRNNAKKYKRTASSTRKGKTTAKAATKKATTSNSGPGLVKFSQNPNRFIRLG
ncbi:Bloom syndrome helicase isoform X1 [Megalopta genalis]|uniref:Bloom syndrome helicase isoform X1 n=1 Tax=Megalopta genalis TaxID=115081 RepID=UPI003FD42B0B